MSGIQYPVGKKDINKFEHQNNISLMSMGTKIKKSSPYVPPPWPMQGIMSIYYISLLAKHLIRYWWKTWAEGYQGNIIVTKANTISVNTVYMAVPVKRYWKTIWEDASYKEHKKSSFQKLMTRRGVTKSSLQKQNSNCTYLLSSTQILKLFYINKTRVNHYHQNPSPPNTNNTYHVEAASMWNAVMDDTLKHPKSI